MHWKGAQEYLGKTTRIVVFLVVGVVVIQYIGVSIGHVGGVSMEPTLVDGERFLVNRAVYLVKAPQREEMVQLVDPNKNATLIVKRVIGEPGDTVRITEGSVSIINEDGEKVLEEPYLPPGTQTNIADDLEEFVIPEHEYFLLGDNRGSSKDSRHFGPIHRKYINGRIIQL
jgi:signal peptidase I